MTAKTTAAPGPVNHIFVDFENVHTIDPAVIGERAVTFTLLAGPRPTKLDISLVEKLFAHADSVQLVRTRSAGRNALDFVVAFYVGRAVAADPLGYFHIVSKDKGFDPLIEHLRSKNIRAHRHNSFDTLTFEGHARPSAPAAVAPAPKSKLQPRPTSQRVARVDRATQVLEQFRKPSATRPKNRKKLVSYLIAHFGHKMKEAKASNIIESLRADGHLVINDKGAVTYQLDGETAINNKGTK